MSRIKKQLTSTNEYDDVSFSCPLQGQRSFSIVTRRGQRDESAIIIRRLSGIAGTSESDINHDEVILAMAIVSTMQREFKGGGHFSIRPSTRATDDEFSFLITSLHDLWDMLVLFDEAVAMAKYERIALGDVAGQWIPSYFASGICTRTSPFVWESEEGIRGEFLMRNLRLESGDKNGKPEAYAETSWRKPDVSEIKNFIRETIRSFPDPDEITEEDVEKAMKATYGISIIGKYGYSKKEIQLWTYHYYGQLDKASQITETLYLGSEYNAGNFDELKATGITHILNVTKEVERFFPDDFEYHQVPVLDEPGVHLLEFFDRALSFMLAGTKTGKVLVHCQRGVSRSASFVIAFLMYTNGWTASETLKYVKERRRIVKPNTGFVEQLNLWEIMKEKFIPDRSFEVKSIADIKAERDRQAIRSRTPSPSITASKEIEGVNVRDRMRRFSAPLATSLLMNGRIRHGPQLGTGSQVDLLVKAENQETSPVRVMSNKYSKFDSFLILTTAQTDEASISISVFSTTKYSVIDIYPCE